MARGFPILVEVLQEVDGGADRRYRLWSVGGSGAEVEQFQVMDEKDLKEARAELYPVVGIKK